MVKSGQPSKVLDSMPTLQPFDADIWNVFSVLSPRRQQTGMGPPSHLAVTEIFAYVDRKMQKHDRESREAIIDLVIWLDNEWMQKVYKRFEESQKAREAQSRTKSRRR